VDLVTRVRDLASVSSILTTGTGKDLLGVSLQSRRSGAPGAQPLGTWQFDVVDVPALESHCASSSPTP